MEVSLGTAPLLEEPETMLLEPSNVGVSPIAIIVSELGASLIVTSIDATSLTGSTDVEVVVGVDTLVTGGFTVTVGSVTTGGSITGAGGIMTGKIVPIVPPTPEGFMTETWPANVLEDANAQITKIAIICVLFFIIFTNFSLW